MDPPLQSSHAPSAATQPAIAAGGTTACDARRPANNPKCACGSRVRRLEHCYAAEFSAISSCSPASNDRTRPFIRGGARATARRASDAADGSTRPASGFPADGGAHAGHCSPRNPPSGDAAAAGRAPGARLKPPHSRAFFAPAAAFFSRAYWRLPTPSTHVHVSPPFSPHSLSLPLSSRSRTGGTPSRYVPTGDRSRRRRRRRRRQCRRRHRHCTRGRRRPGQAATTTGQPQQPPHGLVALPSNHPAVVAAQAAGSGHHHPAVSAGLQQHPGMRPLPPHCYSSSSNQSGPLPGGQPQPLSHSDARLCDTDHYLGPPIPQLAAQQAAAQAAAQARGMRPTGYGGHPPQQIHGGPTPSPQQLAAAAARRASPGPRAAAARPAAAAAAGGGIQLATAQAPPESERARPPQHSSRPRLRRSQTATLRRHQRLSPLRWLLLRRRRSSRKPRRSLAGRAAVSYRRRRL